MKHMFFDGSGDGACGCDPGLNRHGRRGFGRGFGRGLGQRFGRGLYHHAGETLADVSPGTSCTIRRLLVQGAVRQRLLDLGFQAGRAVTILRNAPLNDPIEVQLGDTFIALRRREAAGVAVQTPDYEDGADA